MKSALSDVLDNSQCQVEEVTHMRNVLEDNPNEINSQAIPEKETELENRTGVERALFDNSVAKTTQAKIKDCTNDTKHLEIPTMIPIFKARPVMRNDFTDSFNPACRKTNPPPTPIISKAVYAHSNPIYNAQKFTIPCQKAADVLDMSNVALPSEIPKEHVQPNVQPISPIQRSILSNQSPNTVSIHCADLDESVAMLFKPKAISLIQLYGNLLKKITITVLVPYHMSKMGKQ